MVIHVRAFWDCEAKVWVAESSDVPGLVTEATGPDALQAKLRVLIPELLEANGLSAPAEPDFTVELVAAYAEPVAPDRV